MREKIDGFVGILTIEKVRLAEDAEGLHKAEYDYHEHIRHEQRKNDTEEHLHRVCAVRFRGFEDFFGNTYDARDEDEYVQAEIFPDKQQKQANPAARPTASPSMVSSLKITRQNVTMAAVGMNTGSRKEERRKPDAFAAACEINAANNKDSASRHITDVVEKIKVFRKASM